MDVKNDGVAAGGMLTEAANIVEGARAGTHGPKERSFASIGLMWTAYLSSRPGVGGTSISAYDVAQMMVLLKMMRASQGKPVRDHFVDAAGYAAIAGEIGLFPDDDAAERMASALNAVVASTAETGPAARESELLREIETLKAMVVDGERRLDAAAIAFDAYAMHHFSKNPPDPIKAHRNANLAGMCNGRAAYGFPERPQRISAKAPGDLPAEFRADTEIGVPKGGTVTQAFFTIPGIPPGATRVGADSLNPEGGE